MSKLALRKTRSTAFIKMALVLLLGVAAGAGLFVATLRSGPAPQLAAQDSSSALTGLLDQQAQSFDAASLHGRYTLLYFGFTFCPDACPTALSNLSLALRQLDPDAMRIQPIFVSVDPARDTPAQLAEYLTHFSQHIVGLTGSSVAMQTVAQRFGVIAFEHRDEGLPGGYTMDHSNEFLLLSPEGRLLVRLPANQTADELLEQLSGLTRSTDT
ncbi:MAG: SCO family protein [Steroidobacteraceae bacterium]